MTKPLPTWAQAIEPVGMDEAAPKPARGPRRTPIRQRFHSKYVVEDNGCWRWRGATAGRGYGVLNAGGKGNGWLYAHRVSWELHFGPIPEGLLVCHKCDYPPCVNPDHLFLGTPQDNMSDCAKKGRSTAGERHSLSRLTKQQVIEIRALAGTMLQREIAEKYGVTQAHISGIITGRFWK